MGANAVTTVPVYTAGEVLTAADMNITNSGIPVFATTTTRDAAFDGAGEKTLAEGQFAYIEATNTTQYYDGAAWQSVGVAPGLIYVTGASFSAAATVSFPADTFTSTYENYRVMLNITSATANTNLRYRFRAAGSDNTTSNYAVAGKGRTFGGTDSNYDSVADNGGYLFAPSVANGLKTFLDVFAPKLTQISAILQIAVGSVASGGDGYITMGNQFNATTSFDSMTFYTTSGTITGSYKVYGYSNS